MGTVLRDTIFEENWIIRTVPMISEARIRKKSGLPFGGLNFFY